MNILDAINEIQNKLDDLKNSRQIKLLNELLGGGGGNGVPSPAKKRGRPSGRVVGNGMRPAFKQSGRGVGNGEPFIKTKKKRKMSAAGRLAIAAAQKKRWAKVKAGK